MAFSNMLAEAGHTAESVKTTAKVHLRFVDGPPTIARIDLVVEGRAAVTQWARAQWARAAASRASSSTTGRMDRVDCSRTIAARRLAAQQPAATISPNR